MLARLVDTDHARARFGARADELIALYEVGDPAYEDRPLEPMHLDPPEWLDPERCADGGRVLRRFGLITSSVLRCYALPLSYLSPVGIRPLVATGRLVEEAGPRLYRTAQYVLAQQRPGALSPGGPGWQTASRVRLMHEQVRRQLVDDGWDPRMGAPIPQPDLAATALLFGPVTVEGLRRLGARISAREADDVAHLSRAMAWGQGVLDPLLADTHDEAMDLFELTTSMNGEPDDDGVALMRALLDIPHTIGRTRLDRIVARPLRRTYASLASQLLDGHARELGVASKGRLGRAFRGLTPWMPRGERWARLQDRSVDWVMERGISRLRGSSTAGSTPPMTTHQNDRRTG